MISALYGPNAPRAGPKRPECAYSVADDRGGCDPGREEREEQIAHGDVHGAARPGDAHQQGERRSKHDQGSREAYELPDRERKYRGRYCDERSPRPQRIDGRASQEYSGRKGKDRPRPGQGPPEYPCGGGGHRLAVLIETIT